MRNSYVKITSKRRQLISRFLNSKLACASLISPHSFISLQNVERIIRMEEYIININIVSFNKFPCSLRFIPFSSSREKVKTFSSNISKSLSLPFSPCLKAKAFSGQELRVKKWENHENHITRTLRTIKRKSFCLFLLPCSASKHKTELLRIHKSKSKLNIQNCLGSSNLICNNSLFSKSLFICSSAQKRKRFLPGLRLSFFQKKKRPFEEERKTKGNSSSLFSSFHFTFPSSPDTPFMLAKKKRSIRSFFAPPKKTLGGLKTSQSFFWESKWKEIRKKKNESEAFSTDFSSSLLKKPFPPVTREETKETEYKFFSRKFDKSRLKKFVLWFNYKWGLAKTLQLLETLKVLGFKYAQLSGLSINIEDLYVPEKKKTLLDNHYASLLHQEFQIFQKTDINNQLSINFIKTWRTINKILRNAFLRYFKTGIKYNSLQKTKQPAVFSHSPSFARRESKKKKNNFKRLFHLEQRNYTGSDSLYIMAFSGARGNMSQVGQLTLMRGLMADPLGHLVEYPIVSNFKEGLNLTEFLISCYGARKGIIDTGVRTATAGDFTRRLVDVAHSAIIRNYDCATKNGIYLTDVVLFPSQKTVLSFEQRLIGRIIANNSRISENYRNKEIPSSDFFTNFSSLSSISSILSKKTTHLMESAPLDEEIQFSKKANTKTLFLKTHSDSSTMENEKNLKYASLFKIQEEILVRSPLTCEGKFLCRKCYGWNAIGRIVDLGEAVGVIAAQSLGEPGTQLTLRTFHTGGIFVESPEEAKLVIPFEGNLIIPNYCSIKKYYNVREPISTYVAWNNKSIYHYGSSFNVRSSTIFSDFLSLPKKNADMSPFFNKQRLSNKEPSENPMKYLYESNRRLLSDTLLAKNFNLSHFADQTEEKWKAGEVFTSLNLLNEDNKKNKNFYFFYPSYRNTHNEFPITRNYNLSKRWLPTNKKKKINEKYDNLLFYNPNLEIISVDNRYTNDLFSAQQAMIQKNTAYSLSSSQNHKSSWDSFIPLFGKNNTNRENLIQKDILSFSHKKKNETEYLRKSIIESIFNNFCTQKFVIKFFQSTQPTSSNFKVTAPSFLCSDGTTEQEKTSEEANLFHSIRDHAYNQKTTSLKNFSKINKEAPRAHSDSSLDSLNVLSFNQVPSFLNELQMSNEVFSYPGFEMEQKETTHLIKSAPLSETLEFESLNLLQNDQQKTVYDIWEIPLLSQPSIFPSFEKLLNSPHSLSPAPSSSRPSFFPNNLALFENETLRKNGTRAPLLFFQNDKKSESFLAEEKIEQKKDYSEPKEINETKSFALDSNAEEKNSEKINREIFSKKPNGMFQQAERISLNMWNFLKLNPIQNNTISLTVLESTLIFAHYFISDFYDISSQLYIPNLKILNPFFDRHSSLTNSKDFQKILKPQPFHQNNISNSIFFDNFCQVFPRSSISIIPSKTAKSPLGSLILTEQEKTKIIHNNEQAEKPQTVNQENIVFQEIQKFLNYQNFFSSNSLIQAIKKKNYENQIDEYLNKPYKHKKKRRAIGAFLFPNIKKQNSPNFKHWFLFQLNSNTPFLSSPSLPVFSPREKTKVFSLPRKTESINSHDSEYISSSEKAKHFFSVSLSPALLSLPPFYFPNSFLKFSPDISLLPFNKEGEQIEKERENSSKDLERRNMKEKNGESEYFASSGEAKKQNFSFSFQKGELKERDLSLEPGKANTSFLREGLSLFSERDIRRELKEKEIIRKNRRIDKKEKSTLKSKKIFTFSDLDKFANQNHQTTELILFLDAKGYCTKNTSLFDIQPLAEIMLKKKKNHFFFTIPLKKGIFNQEIPSYLPTTVFMSSFFNYKLMTFSLPSNSLPWLSVFGEKKKASSQSCETVLNQNMKFLSDVFVLIHPINKFNKTMVNSRQPINEKLKNYSISSPYNGIQIIFMKRSVLKANVLTRFGSDFFVNKSTKRIMKKKLRSRCSLTTPVLPLRCFREKFLKPFSPAMQSEKSEKIKNQKVLNVFGLIKFFFKDFLLTVPSFFFYDQTNFSGSIFSNLLVFSPPTKKKREIETMKQKKTQKAQTLFFSERAKHVYSFFQKEWKRFSPLFLGETRKKDKVKQSFLIISKTLFYKKNKRNRNQNSTVYREKTKNNNLKFYHQQLHLAPFIERSLIDSRFFPFFSSNFFNIRDKNKKINDQKNCNTNVVSLKKKEHLVNFYSFRNIFVTGCKRQNKILWYSLISAGSKQFHYNFFSPFRKREKERAGKVSFSIGRKKSVNNPNEKKKNERQKNMLRFWHKSKTKSKTFDDFDFANFFEMNATKQNNQQMNLFSIFSKWNEFTVNKKIKPSFYYSTIDPVISINFSELTCRYFHWMQFNRNGIFEKSIESQKLNLSKLDFFNSNSFRGVSFDSPQNFSSSRFSLSLEETNSQNYSKSMLLSHQKKDLDPADERRNDELTVPSFLCSDDTTGHREKKSKWQKAMSKFIIGSQYSQLSFGQSKVLLANKEKNLFGLGFYFFLSETIVRSTPSISVPERFFFSPSSLYLIYLIKKSTKEQEEKKNTHLIKYAPLAKKKSHNSLNAKHSLQQITKKNNTRQPEALSSLPLFSSKRKIGKPANEKENNGRFVNFSSNISVDNSPLFFPRFLEFSKTLLLEKNHKRFIFSKSFSSSKTKNNKKKPRIKWNPRRSLQENKPKPKFSPVIISTETSHIMVNPLVNIERKKKNKQKARLFASRHLESPEKQLKIELETKKQPKHILKVYDNFIKRINFSHINNRQGLLIPFHLMSKNCFISINHQNLSTKKVEPNLHRLPNIYMNNKFLCLDDNIYYAPPNARRNIQRNKRTKKNLVSISKKKHASFIPKKFFKRDSRRAGYYFSNFFFLALTSFSFIDLLSINYLTPKTIFSDKRGKTNTETNMSVFNYSTYGRFVRKKKLNSTEIFSIIPAVIDDNQVLKKFFPRSFSFSPLPKSESIFYPAEKRKHLLPVKASKRITQRDFVVLGGANASLFMKEKNGSEAFSRSFRDTFKYFQNSKELFVFQKSNLISHKKNELLKTRFFSKKALKQNSYPSLLSPLVFDKQNNFEFSKLLIHNDQPTRFIFNSNAFFGKYLKPTNSISWLLKTSNTNWFKTETFLTKGGLVVHFFSQKYDRNNKKKNSTHLMKSAPLAESNINENKDPLIGYFPSNFNYNFGISFDRTYSLLLLYLQEIKHSTLKPTQWFPFVHNNSGNIISFSSIPYDYSFLNHNNSEFSLKKKQSIFALSFVKKREQGSAKEREILGERLVKSDIQRYSKKRTKKSSRILNKRQTGKDLFMQNFNLFDKNTIFQNEKYQNLSAIEQKLKKLNEINFIANFSLSELSSEPLFSKIAENSGFFYGGYPSNTANHFLKTHVSSFGTPIFSQIKESLNRLSRKRFSYFNNLPPMEKDLINNKREKQQEFLLIKEYQQIVQCRYLWHVIPLKFDIITEQNVYCLRDAKYDDNPNSYQKLLMSKLIKSSLPLSRTSNGTKERPDSHNYNKLSIPPFQIQNIESNIHQFPDSLIKRIYFSYNLEDKNSSANKSRLTADITQGVPLLRRFFDVPKHSAIHVILQKTFLKYYNTVFAFFNSSFYKSFSPRIISSHKKKKNQTKNKPPIKSNSRHSLEKKNTHHFFSPFSAKDKLPITSFFFSHPSFALSNKSKKTSQNLSISLLLHAVLSKIKKKTCFALYRKKANQEESKIFFPTFTTTEKGHAFTTTEKGHAFTTTEKGHALKKKEQIHLTKQNKVSNNLALQHSHLSTHMSSNSFSPTLANLARSETSRVLKKERLYLNLLYNRKFKIQMNFKLRRIILNSSLVKILQKIVNNVQAIYCGQGVEIYDQHIEVIVRQMGSKVRVKESPVYSKFFWNEIIPFNLLKDTTVGEFEPTIFGITKISLQTDSFISAASFQSSVKVLTQESLKRNNDFLLGLKENIIVNELIPSGTGLFSNYYQLFNEDREEFVLDPNLSQNLVIMDLKNRQKEEEEKNKQKKNEAERSESLEQEEDFEMEKNLEKDQDQQENSFTTLSKPKKKQEFIPFQNKLEKSYATFTTSEKEKDSNKPATVDKKNKLLKNSDTPTISEKNKAKIKKNMLRKK